jgi:catechol 2,3-dioxygenase-like lactoylglutathione lyase family enzyme
LDAETGYYAKGENPMTIAYQSAVIFVEDIAASRRFYEELLGQKVEMDFGPNVGFEGGFALWQVDHAFEMVYARSPDTTEPLGRRNFELYFEAADLETVSARLEEAGVAFVHALREQPWGQRVLRVHDPDGHVVEIGEPMPAVIVRLLDEGMSAEDAATRTGMPLEIVEHVARQGTGS